MASSSRILPGFIHISRPPPQNIQAFALSRLSAFCQGRISQESEEVSAETSIWIGDVNSLPAGPDRLAELRLIVVPWAGPFVKPSTRELLARDDKDSSLLEHNDADQGLPRGAHLHLAPQRRPHGRDGNQPPISRSQAGLILVRVTKPISLDRFQQKVQRETEFGQISLSLS